MKVRYFIDIINDLLSRGASQSEVAKELGFSRQNLSEILGLVPEKQRKNLKDEHLPGLMKLCKKYDTEPRTASKLIKMIESELIQSKPHKVK